MTRVSVEAPTNAGGRDLSHEDRVSAAPDEALAVRKLRDRKDGRRPPRTAPNPCAPHEAVARTCAGSWTARCNASGRQFLPTGRKRVEHPLRLPSKYQTNEPGRACQSIELQRSTRAASLSSRGPDLLDSRKPSHRGAHAVVHWSTRARARPWRMRHDGEPCRLADFAPVRADEIIE